MVGDEAGALGRAVFRVLDAALPLQHRPAVEAVSGQLGEDPLEVDLAIARGPEPPGPAQPRLEPTVGAGLAVRPELGVLDVERLDPLVIVIDVGEIIERLQHEMAGIVHDVAAPVAVNALQEHLERQPVVQVLRRVDLVAEVDAAGVEGVEDGSPAPGQLVEAVLDQAVGPLRVRVEVGPEQRTAEGHVPVYAEPFGCLGGEAELVDGPLLASPGIVVDRRRREGIGRQVEGRMKRDELPLQVAGEFRDDQPVVGQPAFVLIAIGLAVGRRLEIDYPLVPGWDLNAFEALACSPSGEAVDAVVWRRVGRELRQEDARSLDRFHVSTPHRRIRECGNISSSISYPETIDPVAGRCLTRERLACRTIID